jgi:hypothetical protein
MLCIFYARDRYLASVRMLLSNRTIDGFSELPNKCHMVVRASRVCPIYVCMFPFGKQVMMAM